MRLSATIARDAVRRSISTAKSDLGRKTIGLTGLTAAGQLVFVVALPVLSRLFSPADFGAFTIYLSFVNLGGPLVALKFDSAIYAARERSEALGALALSFTTIAMMTALVLIGAGALNNELPGFAAGHAWMLTFVIPAGLFVAGAWSVSSAWAVRADAIGSLAIARFLQPAGMTLIQLVGGLLRLPGETLIIAHVISHFGYTSFILARTLSRSEARRLIMTRPRSLLRHAVKEIKFPLFVLPAQLSKLAVANVPPVLLAWQFGADIAGQYGVAYRIIAAPLAIVSLALSNVFTGEVSRSRDPDHIQRLARAMMIASLVFAAAPIIFLGALAPEYTGVLLGERWTLAGEMACAIAAMGAANALAAPFSEITSIFHYQLIRFVTEMTTFALVFAPFAIAIAAGWEVLPTVWGISLGGAVGSMTSLAAVWMIFRRIRVDGTALEPAAVPAN